jgi:hypothetical protein
MHAFALLAFGGLVVALVVRMLSAYGRDMANRASNIVMSAGLGVGYAYLTDFSIFRAWGFGVRSHTVGAIVTGFMVAGLAWLWEEALEFFHNYGHSEAPKRLRRAA